jgi:hypothetical protein
VLVAAGLPAHRPDITAALYLDDEEEEEEVGAFMAGRYHQHNSASLQSREHSQNVRRWVSIPNPLPACPAERTPSDAWRADVLSAFVSLRAVGGACECLWCVPVSHASCPEVCVYVCVCV